MKNLQSSDRNSMVSSSMGRAAVRLATPACTALIWGLNAFPGADSAIWGTLGIAGANGKQDFTAIWGTCGVWSPIRNAAQSRPSKSRPSTAINN